MFFLCKICCLLYVNKSFKELIFFNINNCNCFFFSSIKKDYLFISRSFSLFKRLKLIYCCKEFFLLFKPINMLIYNASNILSRDSVLPNIFCYLFFCIGMRFGIVHRIDFDTSGIIIFARESFFLKNISLSFKKRKVSKYYLVFSSCYEDLNTFSIKRFIVSYKNSSRVRCLDIFPYVDYSFVINRNINYIRYSSSLFLKVFSFRYDNSCLGSNSYTLFVCKILTGRKNQIKAHMVDRYFIDGFNNVFLHSWRLGFSFNNNNYCFRSLFCFFFYNIITLTNIKFVL